MQWFQCLLSELIAHCHMAVIAITQVWKVFISPAGSLYPLTLNSCVQPCADSCLRQSLICSPCLSIWLLWSSYVREARPYRRVLCVCFFHCTQRLWNVLRVSHVLALHFSSLECGSCTQWCYHFHTFLYNANYIQCRPSTCCAWLSMWLWGE